jgi:hypothetical protein
MAEHIIGTDRAADETILAILAMRHRGYTSQAIGRAFGNLKPEYVRTVTNRICNDDLSFSKGVDRAYAKRFWGVAW